MTAMKKSNRVIEYLVTFILVTTLVACASTSQKESTGEYVDDSIITTKVKSQLAADDFLKSFQISVETFKGTVQLSGFKDVNDRYEKEQQSGISCHFYIKAKGKHRRIR
jgi:uncharacterized membrane protein